MATSLAKLKGMIDLPEWRPLSPSQTATIAGHTLCTDLRNGQGGDPYIYKLTGLNTLELYNPFNDEWFTPLAFTTLGGAVAAGSCAVFVPTSGPSGTATGLGTASVTLATLPNSATVLANAFANRGDGVGYKIRIIDSGTGGSGKINERFIVANSAGTTPVVVFDVALDWAPVTGAKYELLSGSVYLLQSGTTAAGFFKKYDVATNTISGNLSVTNLSATIGVESLFIAMDEQYVPYNGLEGDGMIEGSVTYDTASSSGIKHAIQATAAAAGTITGSVLPSALATNEYRNFQIRIVQDTTNVTAVGQRRKIASHTSGAAAVFTLVSNWTVTPSATAEFVIEMCNDLLLWTNSATVTYSYAAGGFAADAGWSTAAISAGATQYANPGTAMGAGCVGAMAFSIAPDTNRYARHSYIYRFRGAATVTLERFDIANGANGTWSTVVPSFPLSALLSTGTSYAHDTAGNLGKYFYVNPNGAQRFFRFDMLNATLEPWCFMRTLGSTAIVGNKMCITSFNDGATVVGMMYYLLHTATPFYNILLQR